MSQEEQALENILAAGETAGRMIWPFDKAFKFAAGRKDLYFSANNEHVQFAEGQLIADHNGANYIRPIAENDSHLLEVHVLRPDLTQEELQSPHMSLEKRNFESRLPVVLRLKEADRPISEITDQEALEAGYSDPNSFRIMMAMQSDKADELIPTIQNVMKPIVHKFVQKIQQDGIIFETPQGMMKGMVPPEQLQELALQLPDLGIQALTGGIDPQQMMSPIHQNFLANLMNELSRTIDPASIPGTVSVYRMRLATPEEYHQYHPDQPSIEQANKTISNALNYFVGRLKHAVFPLDKKIRNRFLDKYGEDKIDGTGLNNMIAKIEARAHEICPPEEHKQPDPRQELETRIKAAKEAGDITDVQRFGLQADLARASGEHTITAIGERLDKLLAGKGQAIA